MLVYQLLEPWRGDAAKNVEDQKMQEGIGDTDADLTLHKQFIYISSTR